MKPAVIAVALAVALLSAPVLAALVGNLGNGNTVILFTEPCDNEAVEANTLLTRVLVRGVPEKFQVAPLVWKGEVISACWAPVDANGVFIVDATGDFGYMPLSALKKDEGI